MIAIMRLGVLIVGMQWVFAQTQSFANSDVTQFRGDLRTKSLFAVQAPAEDLHDRWVIAQDIPPESIPQRDDQDEETIRLNSRIDRLESQLKSMTVQIEQLQFQQRKLEEIIRRSEADNSTRGGTSTNITPPPSAGPAASNAVISGSNGASNGAGNSKRNDAFDPGTDPNVPGAPRILGSANSGSRPLENNAPLVNGGTNGQSVTNQPVAPIDNTTATPLEIYQAGIAYLQQKQYENAENEFQAFLQRNPKSRRAGEATYYLGESYMARQRPREAAEQYLKVSTDFPQSTKAPDALLHLGIALTALNAKEQACATFAEVGHKYPSATATIRSAEKEAARYHCNATAQQ